MFSYRGVLKCFLNRVNPCAAQGCTEHSVGQVTAGEMTLYMRRNPESPTHKQWQEQTVMNTPNDQWLVALSDRYNWNQYNELLYPVIPDYGTSAWLMKMVAAVEKGEIRTKGKEPTHKKNTRNGEGGDRWTETTLILGDCQAPHRQRRSTKKKKACLRMKVYKLHRTNQVNY